MKIGKPVKTEDIARKRYEQSRHANIWAEVIKLPPKLWLTITDDNVRVLKSLEQCARYQGFDTVLRRNALYIRQR